MSINVVVRLPWKRPQEEQKWTSEKDNMLWTFLAMYRSPDMNWDVISNRLAMPIDECIKRAGYLYQQQLHNLQQKRNISSSSSSLLTRQPSQECLVQRNDSPSGRNAALPGLSASPTNNYSPLVPIVQHPYSDKVNPEYLKECVKRHDFDWVSIGHELGMNPLQCRKYYIELEQVNNVNIYTQQPAFKTSSPSSNPIPLTNPLHPTSPYEQPRINPQSTAPPSDPDPKFTNFSLPAFLPDESKANSVVSSLGSNSSGSLKLASDMSDDYNGNSSSGELFSDTSLTRSALESTYFSDPKVLE